MNNKQRVKLCNVALEVNRVFLSQEEYSEIHNYINEYNEWGLGVETLIDILLEGKSNLKKEQFNNILEAMESMDLGESDRVILLNQWVTNI